jgi:hypothetical protein
MKIPKHTSLSLAGNVAQYEYSNKERSKLYDTYDPYGTSQMGKGHKNQSGKGLFADIGGALAGVGAGILGSVAGPFGAAAAGAAGSYGAKKLLEQAGLGYQYKSNQNINLWGTKNALGPVSQNAPIRL